MFTTDSFYRSRTWERFRAALMQERTTDEGIICARCGKPILRRYDCVAHHTIELTDDNVNDFEVSLNPENVELIHFRCHNEEHGRFAGKRSQEVYLVYGPPCAGKTAWVRTIAHTDDLIVDIDALWEAVCLSNRLHKPNRLKANVFGIRDLLIDQIRTRTGQWRAAYIIGGYPLATDRQRLCEMLRAKPIYIEATREECLERSPSADWDGYIEDWFDAYTPPVGD